MQDVSVACLGPPDFLVLDGWSPPRDRVEHWVSSDRVGRIYVAVQEGRIDRLGLFGVGTGLVLILRRFLGGDRPGRDDMGDINGEELLLALWRGDQ